MTPEQAAALRAPFPATDVGKLPKITCPACSKATGRVCPQHTKSRCQGCGGYMTTAHTHLDYVGHAAVTNRLLSVDPAWTWEPVAYNDQGLPLLDDNGGLWMRLTVCGITRLGYGHADGKKGGDAIKEAVGDAIRNSALRAGVAIDLWHKGTLSGATEPTSDNEHASTNEPAAAPLEQPAPQATTVVRRNRPTPTDPTLAKHVNYQTDRADKAETRAELDDEPAIPQLIPTGDMATEKQVKMTMAICSGLNLDHDARHDLVFGASGGRTTHMKELYKREISALIDELRHNSAPTPRDGRSTYTPDEDPF